MTHYDVLGVPNDATPTLIRAAYREQARLLHPDRGGRADGEAASMSVVNEAYRVLADPGRRAVYDRTLRIDRSNETDTDRTLVEDIDHGGQAAVVHPPTRLSPEGPARVPWKLMLIAALVGSALVLVTAALNDPPSEEPPDGIIRAGSCVEIEANGDAREIACSNTPADVVVSLLIPTGANCPAEMAAHRDRLGLGTACIPFD